MNYETAKPYDAFPTVPRPELIRHSAVEDMSISIRDALVRASDVQNMTPEQAQLVELGGKISRLSNHDYLIVEGYARFLRANKNNQLPANQGPDISSMPPAAGEICTAFRARHLQGHEANSASKLLRVCYPIGKNMIEPSIEPPIGLDAHLSYRIENEGAHKSRLQNRAKDAQDYCITIHPDVNSNGKKMLIECDGTSITLEEGQAKIVGRTSPTDRVIYNESMIGENDEPLLPFLTTDLNVQANTCSRGAFLIAFGNGKIYIRDRASAFPVIISTVDTKELAWKYTPDQKNIDGTFGQSIALRLP